jgi:LPXTG-motif cell wall-anchored protein
MDFMGGWGIFIVGGVAIVVLIGILLFLRSRKKDE